MIKKLKTGVKKFVKTVKDNSIFLLSAFLIFCVAIGFNKKLEPYHNSLMLAITLIYVVATVIICDANGKSAKAAREQLAESKRQYADNQRISMMPYLQSELSDGFCDHRLDLWLIQSGPTRNKIEINLKLMNVGIGTAKDIEYVWHSFENSSERKPFPIRALHSEGSQVLRINFDGPAKLYEKVARASIDIYYKDLLENKYVQTIELTFAYTLEVGYDLDDYTISSPLLIEETTNV